MVRYYPFLALLSLAEFGFALPAPSPQQNWSWDNTKYMITFGDSYTYVQGLPYGHQNYSFIGDLLSPSYTPQQLLESKIIQNQTSTAEGGPNWVEYLTGCGLKPGLTSPLSCKRQLWDFAFAGADRSPSTPLHHNFTVPLVNATANFLHYANPTLRTFVNPQQTLVGVWIGINDVGDTASLKNVTSFPALYASILTTLFASVQTLADAGYANFLFLNLPPLDRTPANAARAAPLPNATMVDAWGRELATQAAAFAARNPGTPHADGVRAMVFDANAFLNGVMNDAAAYGIRNVTGYCAGYDQPFVDSDPGRYGCLPLSEYFWFNTGHMTSHVHQILAGAVESFLRSQ
ncbi:hypothetical protein MBLNU459_g0496t2 [Dothideomycetes sp. NU459]